MAAAIGLTGNRLGGRLPGSEPMSVEDIVDTIGALALGVLGVVPVRRRVADGLGRALVGLAALAGAVWLTGGIADVLAPGGSPSATARVLNLLSVALFMPLFVTMVLGPLSRVRRQVENRNNHTQQGDNSASAASALAAAWSGG